MYFLPFKKCSCCGKRKKTLYDGFNKYEGKKICDVCRDKIVKQYPELENIICEEKEKKEMIEDREHSIAFPLLIIVMTILMLWNIKDSPQTLSILDVIYIILFSGFSYAFGVFLSNSKGSQKSKTIKNIISSFFLTYIGVTFKIRDVSVLTIVVLSLNLFFLIASIILYFLNNKFKYKNQKIKIFSYVFSFLVIIVLEILWILITTNILKF